MDISLEGILAIAIVLLFVLLVYSKVKKQSLRETFEEIKNLLGIKNE